MRRELAFIPQDRPGYLHSFALTRRYVAVHTQPWEFDLAKFLSPDRGPIATNYIWDGSQPSIVHLIDRKRGGVAASFELDPSFVFHNINAFDDGDRVVMDVCAHRDSSIVDAMYLKKMRKDGSRIPQAHTAAVDPTPGSAQGQAARPRRGELRVAPDRLRGRQRAQLPLRLRHRRSPSSPQRVHRSRSRSSTSSARSRPTGTRSGTYPGEPIFVRRPGGRGERRRCPALGRPRRRTPDLVPARARCSRHDRARPCRRAPSHPVRLPRPSHWPGVTVDPGRRSLAQSAGQKSSGPRMTLSRGRTGRGS